LPFAREKSRNSTKSFPTPFPSLKQNKKPKLSWNEINNLLLKFVGIGSIEVVSFLSVSFFDTVWEVCVRDKDCWVCVFHHLYVIWSSHNFNACPNTATFLFSVTGNVTVESCCWVNYSFGRDRGEKVVCVSPKVTITHSAFWKDASVTGFFFSCVTQQKFYPRRHFQDLRRLSRHTCFVLANADPKKNAITIPNLFGLVPWDLCEKQLDNRRIRGCLVSSSCLLFEGNVVHEGRCCQFFGAFFFV